MRKVGLICLIMCLALVGCGQRHKNEPLWIVENGGGCDPGPPIWMAVATEKSELNTGEDLPVKLYYQPFADYKEYLDLKGVNCTITMEQSGRDDSNHIIDGEKMNIRTIKNFSDELYVDYDHNGYHYTSALEEITVPAEWFAFEKGAVTWCITFELVLSGCDRIAESGGISLYYLKSGDLILLFDSYYHFSNYKK